MSKVSAKTIQVAVADLNGILRGKILPSKNAKKLHNKSIRLPLSALNLDLLGEDIENSPFVFESGDTDGYISSTGREPFRFKWLENAPLFYPCWMFTDDDDDGQLPPIFFLARLWRPAGVHMRLPMRRVMKPGAILTTLQAGR